MPLQTGQMLNNRYRIVRLLGQGGFGAVYRAWDANLNKPCAVKENLDTSPEAQRQFAREATVLANLSHPNLPRVTDHFSLPDQGQYLVMDFVEGEDLASLVQRLGPVPLGQALIWISQVADALTYMHTLTPPVVHRDIKPANIRITPDGRVMLVDFGLVKLYSAQFRTTMGARAVTPGYAPPEQYGQGNTDARTDIYAMGATLYSIITGQDPVESVQRMVGKELRPAHQIAPSLPVPVGLAIERAMRLEPSQRFQSAAEFKAALTRTDPTMMVKPVPEAYVRPAVQAPSYPGSHAPAQPAPQVPVKSAPRKKSRRIGLWIGIVLVVVFCLIPILGFAVLVANETRVLMQQTADAQLQSTLDERVRTTSTAQAYATATEKAKANARFATSTAQALATSTSRAVATEQGLLSYVASLQAASSLAYGPTSGSLTHSPEDDLIEVADAAVNLRDFIVDVTFTNPYSPGENGWDYGFIFRHEDQNTQFRFVIRSNKTWELLNNTGDPDGSAVDQGDLADLNVAENGTNYVRLVCQGEKGLFFLNGVFISEVDLTARMNSGDIYLATGIYSGDEVAGKSTGYSDFTIWATP